MKQFHVSLSSVQLNRDNTAVEYAYHGHAGEDNPDLAPGGSVVMSFLAPVPRLEDNTIDQDAITAEQDAIGTTAQVVLE